MPSDLKPQTATVNSRLWGARAKDWANLQEACCRPVYEAVLKRCAVSKATRYLDAGCGAGMAAQIAAERGAEVTGIDASTALLEIARSRVPNGDFRAGDLEALPYSDGAFDVVTGFNSFQYAGNPIIALGEARRVTKSDGKLVIMTWGDPAQDGRRFAGHRPASPYAAATARRAGSIRLVRRNGAAQICNRR